MPLQKLEFRPGLNREGTDYANEGGYYDGDKIRFRSGFPEKIGGWSRLSSATYEGTARNLWNWQALNGSNYLGVGTNLKYYIESGGAYNDITPFVKINTLTNKLSVSTGSSLVTIVDATYTPNVGDYLIIAGASTINAEITATVLNQEYHVVTSVSGTTYQIDVGVVSLSTVPNAGGTFTISYEVPIGLDTYTTGTGWGAGPWSRGTWGSAYTGSSSGVGNQLRLWSSDNFGQDLVLAPRGGNIFYWEAVNGVSTRAKLLSTIAGSAYVPTQTNQVLSSAIQKFVIAFGANPYFPGDPATTFNPMLVRWSDQLDPNQWIPDVTNQAGEFALTNGSYIMCARATRQEILVWTDSALYSMQYLGAPYVWGFNVLMDNISIISPNAAITINNVTYWMGTDKFYMYSGRVETLPCSLRQYVFGDLNKDQGFQVFAGSNEGYNEVWWFYVSNESSNNTVDKYVIYNYVDRVWYYGTMARTAWLDSGIRQYPMAADYNHRILYHESSVDDNAGDASLPINAYVQSSDFDIGDGHNFGFVWRILPDINFNGSTVNNPAVTMTVKPRVNSGTKYGQADSPAVVSADNYGTSQVFNIQQFTGQVYTRLRGRQLAFRIESTGLGVSWQLGCPRIDIRQDGRR